MSECAQEIERQNPDNPDKHSHFPGLRILVVDDNEASAKILGWSLEILGHEIWIAHDGANALAMALDLKPQVVLMDINLSGLNGYELCRIMRSEYGFEQTLFIAQTGWGEAEHRRRSREAGFAWHLVKPVDMTRLEEVLNSYMRAHPSTG